MTLISINSIGTKSERVRRRTRYKGRAAATPAEQLLWQALEEVEDPEYPISVVDMGLIYQINLAADTAKVDMTFTSMGCPCMEYITFDIRERLLQEPNINQVDLQIVWDPPWTSKQLTTKGREQLKKWGVAA